jgi:hypothetical protein
MTDFLGVLVGVQPGLPWLEPRVNSRFEEHRTGTEHPSIPSDEPFAEVMAELPVQSNAPRPGSPVQAATNPRASVAHVLQPEAKLLYGQVSPPRPDGDHSNPIIDGPIFETPSSIAPARNNQKRHPPVVVHQPSASQKTPEQQRENLPSQQQDAKASPPLLLEQTTQTQLASSLVEPTDRQASEDLRVIPAPEQTISRSRLSPADQRRPEQPLPELSQRPKQLQVPAETTAIQIAPRVQSSATTTAQPEQPITVRQPATSQRLGRLEPAPAFRHSIEMPNQPVMPTKTERTVQITIGRLEVRMNPAPTSQARQPVPSKVMGLEEYLAQRRRNQP